MYIAFTRSGTDSNVAASPEATGGKTARKTQAKAARRGAVEPPPMAAAAAIWRSGGGSGRRLSRVSSTAATR
jgi:hypothetical protein